MKKVLIVDDERDFCSAVKRNLESSGKFQVEIASEVSGILPLIRRFGPDVVLLDILMPGKSGTAIASELKENAATQNIPIVFLTGIVRGEEVQKQGNVIGGEYFVSKPVETEELIDVIERITGKNG